MRLYARFLACILSGAILLTGCNAVYQVEVCNVLPTERTGELAGFDAAALGSLAGGNFVIRNASGEEIPWQLTHDGQVVFPASVPASGTAVYTVRKGRPAPVDTVACGRMFPERKDDIGWENDKCAFRTYGPALVRSGQHAYGYDAFTKSVSRPVLEDWYGVSTSRVLADSVKALQAAGRKKEAGVLKRRMSIHHDHGTGMDAYEVGPTLGCGATALLDGGKTVYQWGYETYEILDAGPLRFTFRLDCYPRTVGGDTVVEHRLISLDAGSHLNRATVSCDGLSAPAGLVAGIVVHRDNPDEYTVGDRLAGYADPMTLRWNPEGKQFTGIIFPQEARTIGFHPLGEEETEAVEDGATGHLAGRFTLAAGESFTYWFGTAWSKVHFPDLAAWTAYLESMRERYDNPLTTTVTQR